MYLLSREKLGQLILVYLNSSFSDKKNIKTNVNNDINMIIII